ncbi:MAG: hypothetical protein M3N19_06055 [Candidatus Eremiobacteraeota bacterium]|nr:hypothetical protein [Candidatus Eremiobacteraeota bacterium]
MRFLMPWLRSDIRLTGRFRVSWLRGFERIEGIGEELSAFEIVVLFPQEPPTTPIRIHFDVNGKKLAGRIQLQKAEPPQKAGSAVRYRCSFVAMGVRERADLNDALENAPSPPYKRERLIPLIDGSATSRKRSHHATVSIPAEIEAKIVDFLVSQRRIAAPNGAQRPLLAIKEASPITEADQEGMRYRVRSRLVNNHGITKNFDTPIFIPNKGELRILT